MPPGAFRSAVLSGTAAPKPLSIGTNGRWRDVLDADEVDKYERIAAQELTPDCIRWLAGGEITA